VRTHLDIARVIAAPPDAAWDLLTDTTRWTAWGPSIAEVRSSTSVVELGTTGRIRPLLGPWVPFRVTSVDPGRRWAWRVAGLPATGHRVEPVTTSRSATGDRCRVVFEVPVLAAPYAAVCALALRRIERLLLAPPAVDGSGRRAPGRS
jgi:uncharacterized protein YndB with AHSA1/START domain